MFEKNYIKKLDKNIINILNHLSVYCMLNNAKDDYSLSQVKDLRQVLNCLKNSEKLQPLEARANKFFELALKENSEYLRKYSLALKEAIKIVNSDDSKLKNRLNFYIDEQIKILNEREIQLNEKKSIGLKN